MTSANVEVILGPPGCGKTTALLHRVQNELERGTPPERIAFVSFTRAARREFLDRVGRRFSLGPDQFPWLRTVHGTAYRLLEQPDSVMDGPKWREFGDAFGYRFTPTVRFDAEEGLGASPRQTPDDVMRATYEWGRNRGLDVEQTLARAPAKGIAAESFRRFVRRYDEFKHAKRLIDFNDLLTSAIARDEKPPVDAVFIDEAQDLSPLQIHAVQTWFAHCRSVHVAGDDDQAIYGFQGADPGWLLQLAEDYRPVVLAQSYRVPAKVNELAQLIIGRNQRRIQKEYRPRSAEGVVEYLHLESALREIDGARETLVLVRNRCFLPTVATELVRRGVPFVVEGGGAPNPLDELTLSAARAALGVAAGTGVSAEDFRAMLELIPSNGTGLLPRGIKKEAEALRDGVSSDVISRMLKGGRLLEVAAAGGPLAVLTRLQPETRTFLDRVLKRHGTLLAPKVRLTTIHGAKGREADLVVILPEMTGVAFRESLDQRNGGAEAENRVAYVGVTRAKERLIVCAPRFPRSYSYPRVAAVTSRPSQAMAGSAGV